MSSSAFLKQSKGFSPLPEFGPNWTLVGLCGPLTTGRRGGSCFSPRLRIVGRTFLTNRMYQLFILQGILRRCFKQFSTSYFRLALVRGPWHSVCPRRFV